MVLSSWHSHCESSPGSFDECRLSAGWPPTLRPNQPIWAVSPPIGCYHPQTPSPFIIITQLVSWYSFYRPTEGRRLSRPRHCSNGAQPMPKAVYRSDCRDKHNRPRWDSNLGPLAPQSGVLPLSHRDLWAKLTIYQISAHQMRQVPTVRCRTAVVTRSTETLMMTTVNEEVVTDAELSVVFRRPTHRHSYTATPRPPPAGSIGSTADCRQISEDRNTAEI